MGRGKEHSLLQRFLVPLFTFVWWNRLIEPIPWDHTQKTFRRRKVIKVKGWRTALTDSPFGGQRSTVTFLFNWEKFKKIKNIIIKQ